MRIEERHSPSVRLHQKAVIAIQHVRKAENPLYSELAFEDVTLPRVTSWIVNGGSWAMDGGLLKANPARALTFASPAITLEAGYVYVVTLSLNVGHDCHVALYLDRFRNGVRRVS